MIAARWLVWWSTLCLVLALDLPGPAPRSGPWAAAAIAAGAAVATFAALAQGRVRPLMPPHERRPAAVRIALHLTARAAFEEALWRGVVLGYLAAVVGTAAGIVLSTAAFAGSHAATQGRRAAVHLVTGAAFAATYVVTGHLLAAVAAHAAYNALVSLAVISDRTWPDRAIVGRVPTVYDRATEGLL